MNKHFKIIVPLHNAENWVKYCVRSVQKQNYDNFQCVIIDDASTDSSSAVIEDLISKDERFTLITNKTNVGALENIYNAIEYANPDDEDIIVNLDGDDWFSSSEVLSTLVQYYSGDCLMTYGSHVNYPGGARSKFCSGPVPKHIIDQNKYRTSQWMTSALRTFKYKLWKEIDIKDLKNKEGKFYEAAWDLAYMFPMLEMAGHRARFVEEIVYVYNHHDSNDHKIPEKRKKQLDYEREIRNKEPYERLGRKITTNYSDRFVIQDPLDLLTPSRFDVAAKVLYARHREKAVHDIWAKHVYEHHLDVWGGFTEKSPRKDGVEDFYKAFHEILVDVKERGFDEEKSYIPVTKSNMLLNGAHRISAAITHDKPVVCKVSDMSAGQLNCSSFYFKEKRDIVPTGLEETVSDSIALEYTNLKKTTYMMTIYQHCHSHMQKINTILSKHGVHVVYTKNITLSEVGKLNYVHTLYSGEPWIGSYHNNFPGIEQQAKLSFAAGPDIIAALVQVELHSNLVAAKEEIRELVGVGKPSIHTTDTRDETWRNATTCFNNETIDYINSAPAGAMYAPEFQKFISETKKIISEADVELEDICIVGSAPLAAYGKRKCRDFDIFHLPGKISFNEEVASHNQYVRYYPNTIEETIFNPKNHFYIEGLKFITADGMIKMKTTRAEEKDIKDVEMFEG